MVESFGYRLECVKLEDIKFWLQNILFNLLPKSRIKGNKGDVQGRVNRRGYGEQTNRGQHPDCSPGTGDDLKDKPTRKIKKKKKK